MPIVLGAQGLEAVASILIQVDPTSAGYEAPLGSLAYSFATAPGKLYIKIGGLPTDWTQVALGTAGGGTSDGVSITGVGSQGDPFAIIPAYVEGLVAPTLPAVAANLTDANASISPAASRVSVATLPAATLSDNRTLTLLVTGSPKADAVFQVIRRDLTNKTYAVKDDAGTTLATFDASPGGPEGMTFYYDSVAAHYKLLNFFYVEA